MLNQGLGAPLEPFKVWQFTGSGKTEQADFSVETLAGGWRRITWPGQSMAAAVRVTVDSPGGRVIFRAHSGFDGTGQVADEETVTNALTGAPITLVGAAIGSVSVLGPGHVTVVELVDLQDLVDHPGWKLVETVGLPVDDRFAGLYPLDPQGATGDERDPVDAAIRRVELGTPTIGWAATTDLGRPAPGYQPPDPTALVVDELAPVMENLLEMLSVEPERGRQADLSLTRPIRAPRSIHGVDAPARWQSSSEADLRPLGTMLIAAGTDSWAALGLGFGTTILRAGDGTGDRGAVIEARDAATNPARFGVYMVTLQHEATIKTEIGPFTFEVPFVADLACLVLAPDATVPGAPTGVQADRADPTRIQTDRPAARDQRWLEVVDLSWHNVPARSGAHIVPTAYAVLEAVGTADPGVALDKRVAGGFRNHGVAVTDDPDRVRFARSGVAEAFPADPSTVTFSVGAVDWFGRWGPWASVVHDRIVVAPERPVLRSVELDVENGGSGPGAEAVVEFAWDWGDRSPKRIAIRLQLHDDGTPPPPLDGSVLTPDGPAVPDLSVSFVGAGPETPPAGLVEVVEERVGTVRVYRAVVPGLDVAFGAHPRVRVTARARANERVRPAVVGAWSNAVTSTVMSPLPPPAPFVPAAMRWASLPDSAGVSRARLTWTGSGPTFAVYAADESAIARELGLPSPDLDVPPAQRLVPLRSEDFSRARRAFRRIAEDLAEPSLQASLPRGSALIHFYGIAPVSGTGAERRLPADANQYLAVATPTRLVPTAPTVIARNAGGSVQLAVQVTTDPVAVERLEVFRVRDRALAGTPEAAGTPVLVASIAGAIVDAETGVARWDLTDPDPPTPWTPVFYRAVCWSGGDPAAGIVAGRSPWSGAVEVVVPGTAAPVVANLQVLPPSGAMTDATVRFETDALRLRTRLGAFRVRVTAVYATATGPEVTTPAADVADLEAHTGLAPLDESLFLHRSDTLAPFAVMARIPPDPLSVVVEVSDPSGRRSRDSWSAP